MLYRYLSSISTAIRSGADPMDVADSLSPTQYASKRWLVDMIQHHRPYRNPSILILGGWYGSYLVPMLTEALAPREIVLNDKNPGVLKIAKGIHQQQPNVKYECFDVTDTDKRFDVDIVINTSCEHMPTVGSSLIRNPDCLYALQSCDNPDDPGHINIAQNSNHFATQTGLSDIVFKGTMAYGHKNRFMVIGYK